MTGRLERRKWKRMRTAMTALVRRPRARGSVILRVGNLGPDGALCRTRVPFRLGATFHAEFLVDGNRATGRPRMLRAFCRVVWTAARVGPVRPIQEIGVCFLELDEDDRQLLDFLLTSSIAA